MATGTRRGMGERTVQITITVPVNGANNVTERRMSELEEALRHFINGLRWSWIAGSRSHVEISYDRHIEHREFDTPTGNV